MGSKQEYSSLPDDHLLILLRKGDLDAFTQIYNRYRTPLIIHVNNMVKDQDYAQDIVQEVFSWLYQKSHTLEIKTTLASYLYTAVRYKVLNAIAQKKTKTNYLESLANYTTPSSESADQRVRLKELTEIIEAEIQKMPPRMKEIFELSRKKHLTQKEIADLLGISENTVNVQIQRALQALRKNKNIQTSLGIVLFQMMSGGF